MGYGITDRKHYKNIANAIRGKNPRVTGGLKPGEMANAIALIDGKDLVSSSSVTVTPAVSPQTVTPSGVDYFSSVDVNAIPYSSSLNDGNGLTVQIG